MPIASFKYVRDVSSEDEVHCARNLLQAQCDKKWRTKTTGERSAHVILELEEPQQITGLDIGNEHSAFIEVLVGNTMSRDEDFSELLLSSSFMTPAESKNSTSINRVRCFSSEALVQASVAKKWKLVKVICTQPYNKHVKYGLSFLKLHIVADKVAPKAKPLCPLPVTKAEKTDPAPATTNLMKVKAFGKFSLRPESPLSEPESSSVLFTRWKTDRVDGDKRTDEEKPQKNGNLNSSRLKEAEKPCSSNEPAQSSKAVSRDRNRDELMFAKDEEEENPRRERLEKAISKDRQRLLEEAQKKDKAKEAKKLNSSIKKEEAKKLNSSIKKEESKKLNSSVKKEASPKPAVLKQKNSSEVKKVEEVKVKKRPSSGGTSTNSSKKACLERPIKYRPFKKLLDGVVLVISGIQNPDRSTLRSKALEMGSVYKADWQDGCTHLICAFKNTPKYNQVKGKGKIVTRQWIEECYRERKYLPWRRFALDTDLRTEESDEEIVDEAKRPSSSSSEKPPSDASVCKMYDCSDQESGPDDGQDTDDEIANVNKGISAQKRSRPREPIFEEDTVEEDYLKAKRAIS